MEFHQLTLRQEKIIAAPIVWSGYAFLLCIVTPLKRIFMDGFELFEHASPAHESIVTSGLFGLVGLILAVGWTFAVMSAIFARQLRPMGVLAVLVCLSSGGTEAIAGWIVPVWNAAILQLLQFANLGALIVALLLSLATTLRYCSLVYRSRRAGRVSPVVSKFGGSDPEASRRLIQL